MKFELNTMLKNKLIPAILSIALGIVMIIARRAALDLLVKIIGGMIAAGGVAFFVAWFFRPAGEEGRNTSMILGPAVIMIAVGLLMIFFAKTVVDIFPVLMGIVLILNGIGHLTAAGMNGDDRLLLGLLGIVTIALGILLVARPGFMANAVVIWIGAFFVVNGIFDLFMIKRVTGSGGPEA